MQYFSPQKNPDRFSLNFKTENIDGCIKSKYFKSITLQPNLRDKKI